MAGNQTTQKDLLLHTKEESDISLNANARNVSTLTYQGICNANHISSSNGNPNHSRTYFILSPLRESLIGSPLLRHP